jgi:hypothetical protein
MLAFEDLDSRQLVGTHPHFSLLGSPCRLFIHGADGFDLPFALRILGWGWYNYLADTLQFPFSAQCVARRTISPLEPGDEVKVVGMAPEEECEHEMFVLIQGTPHPLAVSLIQLEGTEVDEETQQAIEDWHYWVDRGYEL